MLSPRANRQPVQREQGRALEDDQTGGRKIFRVMGYKRFFQDSKESLDEFEKLLANIDCGDIVNLTFHEMTIDIAYLSEVIKVDRKEYDSKLPIVESNSQPSLFPKE